MDFSSSAPEAAPDNVVATALNATAANVSWGDIPEEKRMGVIKGYSLQYFEATDPTASKTQHLDKDCHSKVLTELKPYTNYSVMVSGYTSAGKGNDSEPVLFTTGETGECQL